MRGWRHVGVGWTAVQLGCGGAAPLLPVSDWFPPAASVSVDDTATPYELVETPDHCPDPMSWANTGEPYLLTYCSGCHAAGVAEEARYGATLDVVLDSADQVFAHAERVAARVEDGTMPPSGGPDDAENACFIAWLEQGARGRGDALFSAEAGPIAPAAWEVLETVDVDADFPEGLTWSTTQVGLGRPVLRGLWSVERWLVDGDDAWLVERARFDGDGTLLTALRWDPPLRFSMDGGEDSWTIETERVHEDADGETVLTEVWDFVRDVDDPDPRAIDTAPVRIVGVERGSGAELGLSLSARMGPVQRWSFDDSADHPLDPELTEVDVLVFESLLPGVFDGVPLTAGMEWSARILGDAP